MTGHEVSDGRLLHDFIRQRDQDAFAVLVERHGPMVLNVCQRVLRDRQDAEDAFQATFLVLARKAGSIVRPELLPNWLYGVAYRVALKARSGARKRPVLQDEVIDVPAADTSGEAAWTDLRPVLDEEISRLPEKYRTPFVLCYLQGKTNREAAQLLGCPHGTILSRLATARERLRTRLVRRGITLASGVLVTMLAESASASVPAALVISTSHAAAASAAGQAVAGVVSAQAAALSEGVMRAMFLTKLKMVAVGMLSVLLVGLALTMFAFAQQPADDAKLQGVRKAVAVQADGQQVLGQESRGGQLQQVSLTLKNNGLTLVATGLKNGANLEDKDIGTFELDPSKSPRWITWTKRDSGKEWRGIYQLKGDRLKICISNLPDRERPTEFTAPAGSRRVVYDFRREPSTRK